jgi:hypothetical protein
VPVGQVEGGTRISIGVAMVRVQVVRGSRRSWVVLHGVQVGGESSIGGVQLWKLNIDRGRLEGDVVFFFNLEGSGGVRG